MTTGTTAAPGRSCPKPGPRATPRAAASGRSVVAPAGEVVRLYRLGLTMAEIAGIHRVSEWTIAARLDEARVRRRAPGSRTTLPLERAVRAYRRQPHRLGELAARLGISAQLIVDRSLKPALRDRGQGLYRADVRAGDVARLYQAGWTVGQIARKYRAAAATILRRLDEAGVPRRPTSVPVPFPVDEAARRVQEEGISFAELARTYQVGVDSVRGQLAARGVRAPRHAPRVLRGVPATQIVTLYGTGLSMTRIAGIYGVSPWVIGARMDTAGAARRPAGKPIPLQEAAASYRAGASVADLAARYGMSVRTVNRKLASAGITLRPPGGRRKDIPVEEAAALYAAGDTMRQLAERYQVCETVIYNRLCEAGVPIRRKTEFKQVDTDLLARLARQAGLDAIR